MGYWKARVVPRIMKLFEKDGAKKAAAGEACKSFDDAKEEMNKAFEEKKRELQPKVIQIFEQSSAEIKATVREPTEAAVKNIPSAIAKLFEELSEIDFPGAKAAGEAATKCGVALIAGPVVFVLEKVVTLLPAEAPKPEEPDTGAAADGGGVETAPAEEEQKKEEEAPPRCGGGGSKGRGSNDGGSPDAVVAAAPAEELQKKEDPKKEEAPSAAAVIPVEEEQKPVAAAPAPAPAKAAEGNA
ncbi:unnamed protein product [Spirodela intermedia]|uniref:Uncharacterized protein n=1 Tax=Spirodela intermedia TaxID=51605 RepID=A0A7I8JTA8_SPIIN|nr:unnamed protein product [Spirodela intermedia]CAA6672991.1 unnamed protein product [Spirodela intermedia]